MGDEDSNRLAQVMRARAKSLRAEFEATEIIHHSGTKGSWREVAVQGFLQATLSERMRTAHGCEIVSASGGVSNECDIVIFDRDTPPFLAVTDGAVIPNECVYGVVEVKTQLTKKELADACDKIRRVKMLEKIAFRDRGRPQYEANGRMYDYFPTVGMVFAFGGPSLSSIANSLRAWTCGKPVEEWPDSIWVLGKGFISWWNSELNLIEMTPSSSSTIAISEAEPGGDILLPLALNLNIMFGQAAMAPLSLVLYSGDAALGRNLRIWTDDS